MIRVALLASIFTTAFTLTGAAPAFGQRENDGARALFAGGPAGAFGVHYWIELEGVGPVTEGRRFVTAERIVIHVRSNADGVLAVWALTNDGGAELLLPTNSTKAIALRAGQTLTTPPIRFRPPAIDERLVIAFGRSQADFPAVGSLADASALLAIAKEGGRDLIIEVNEATPGAIGTYLVRRTAGPIVRELRLRHVRP